MPRIWQNAPNRFQNPPRDLPKPDKLKPKSDPNLPSWGLDGHPAATLALLVAILVPSWPILGATFRILAPAWVDFFRNSSLHRAEVEKKRAKSPSGPPFSVFLKPPDDDFHPFSCCVFLVFVSVYNNIVRIMDLLPCVHK